MLASAAQVHFQATPPGTFACRALASHLNSSNVGRSVWVRWCGRQGGARACSRMRVVTAEGGSWAASRAMAMRSDPSRDCGPTVKHTGPRSGTGAGASSAAPPATAPPQSRGGGRPRYGQINGRPGPSRSRPGPSTATRRGGLPACDTLPARRQCALRVIRHEVCRAQSTRVSESRVP